MMIQELSWVEPFRRLIGLELRLTEYRTKHTKNGDLPVYAEYDVISPTGEALFFVGGFFDADYIGSSNGPFCNWRPVAQGSPGSLRSPRVAQGSPG